MTSSRDFYEAAITHVSNLNNNRKNLFIGLYVKFLNVFFSRKPINSDKIAFIKIFIYFYD